MLNYEGVGGEDLEGAKLELYDNDNNVSE